MDLVVAIIIAGGLGVWTYVDAKGLDQRGIRVLKWSPVVWGWVVFLFALLFGILYLVNRRKAIAESAAPRPMVEPAAEPDPEIPRRFCPKCGTQIVRYAAVLPRVRTRGRAHSPLTAPELHTPACAFRQSSTHSPTTACRWRQRIS